MKPVVFFVGGGTAGSVMPLLAVAEQLPECTQYFIGTRLGVERDLVPRSMRYLILPAGKLRRYFAWQNMIDPFKVLVAFMKALYFIVRYRPRAVVSTGSFVATPVVWAAWCCGVKVVVHQQDLIISLTTKLTKPFATILTKAFADIPLRGAEWIGNPVRDLTPTTQRFKLDRTVPAVFIFGGGTGAAALNELVTPALCDFANIIHVTGKNKQSNLPVINHPRYYRYELLQEEYKEALAKADVVVARAGLGTISELAALGKPAIIVPIPKSHQEYNAQFLQQHAAAMVLDQTTLTAAGFTQAVHQLIIDKVQQDRFSNAIKQLLKPAATEHLAQKIRGTIQ